MPSLRGGSKDLLKAHEVLSVYDAVDYAVGINEYYIVHRRAACKEFLQKLQVVDVYCSVAVHVAV